MSSHQISHIALHVESLRQAARFYSRLFDLQVLRAYAARAGEDLSSFGAPLGQDQADLESLGDGCILGRGDFRLALWGDAAEAANNGRLAHIGLRFLGAMEGFRYRAVSLGCRILQEDARCLVFEDVYGICWHISAGFLSAGEDDISIR